MQDKAILALAQHNEFGYTLIMYAQEQTTIPKNTLLALIPTEATELEIDGSGLYKDGAQNYIETNKDYLVCKGDTNEPTTIPVEWNSDFFSNLNKITPDALELKKHALAIHEDLQNQEKQKIGIDRNTRRQRKVPKGLNKICHKAIPPQSLLENDRSAMPICYGAAANYQDKKDSDSCIQVVKAYIPELHCYGLCTTSANTLPKGEWRHITLPRHACKDGNKILPLPKIDPTAETIQLAQRQQVGLTKDLVIRLSLKIGETWSEEAHSEDLSNPIEKRRRISR